MPTGRCTGTGKAKQSSANRVQEAPQLQPYEDIEMLISVKNEGAAPGALNKAEVKGGGAPTVSEKHAIRTSAEPVSFGAEDFRMVPEEEGGVDTQAGSHPPQLTRCLAVNQSSDPVRPPALPSNLRFKLTLGGGSVRRCCGVTGLVLAAALGGCGGSSGHPSAIGVGVENKSYDALVERGEVAVAKTPTTGPLASEPKIAVPGGPAPSTLVKKDLVVGDGAEVKAGEIVTVNYVGELYKNGKVFEASWKRKEPFQFRLGEGKVIKGWDEGVAGMKVGGRRELEIPAALGYGKLGSPPTIPRNSALVFVIDLLGVGH